MQKEDATELILKTLSEKSLIKQQIYNNTLETFKSLKKISKYLITNYKKQLKNSSNKIPLEYKDKGTYQAELRVAGDLLILNMHTNVFEFDKEHAIWKLPYVENNEMNSYCGIINIYNFLSDSFKYDRLNDVGYLIGRIFVNKDKHYFTEGKRQLGFLYNEFENAVIDTKALKDIIQSAILYTLDFDLLVPPYENMQVASVAQMKQKVNKAKIQTGKRLGFKFYTDEKLT
ncbi:MAG: hypothetical protein DRJ01_09195 [Bacteroidetes bacterium]|nr:MAG: hypothetical protein DRJ01_09195 [Bacteroidota bacterium]